MPIQVFADDSGVKGTDPVIVIAGQYTQAFMWAEFSDRWKDALNATPAIRRFKMNDASKLKGAFGRLTPDERDDKLYRLARVISRSGFPAIHCTTNTEPFDSSIAASLPSDIRNPYVLANLTLLAGVCFELLGRGQTTPFEMIFDDHYIFRPRIEKYYPLIREVISSIEPRAARILPVSLQFQSDDDQMPLQAVDMLAWFLRRRAPGSDPEDSRFDRLIRTIFTIPVSENSTVFVGEQWRARFDALYTPSVIDKVVSVYDRMFGS